MAMLAYLASDRSTGIDVAQRYRAAKALGGFIGR